ncbi:MAG: phenylalanine--tRNA ligase subunit beta [Alphaproteobacteria bacterium]|nr:phenylalanine--tRNA ligase subunit beta [Alphaproteobacteria bacterium]
MKFTLDWLKEHLQTDVPAATIVDTLTMIGLEVESVEDQARALEPFVVAYVVSAQKHPNSDHLQVCMVDSGSGTPIKVVCGAPNARTGMKGVFAPVGTYIPGSDFTLGKGRIRGEDSNGMLCSERELLLSDDHTGIIELPDDAPVGMKYVEYKKLGGVVIDVAITPNRGDCTGIFGIARDLAAAGVGDLIDKAIMPVRATGGETPIPIELRFAPGEEQVCRMFAGRLVRNVKNGPSPQWLQDRLRAVGLRPINTLADITNYISQERGRPLHVYDADKIAGTIHARMGKKGESFNGLDDKTHEVDETMCVIADDSGVLGLGGILGGEESSCTDATTSVFIECAWFEAAPTARTGRKTGIMSDARYRFERYVDPAFVKPGIELATRMVLELCGGEACEVRVAGNIEPPETIIDFPLSEIQRLTGLRVGFPEVKAILTRLGFWVSGTHETVKVAVPSWRPDVTQKADIVEEVMRMEGVDRVPVEPLPRLSGVAETMLTGLQNRRRLARRALAARGLDEAVTWSFISEDLARMFGGGGEALKLANPIATDLTDMRPSLLPGLLSAIRRNQNRAIDELDLFEVGQVFLSDEPGGQHTYATAIRAGHTPRSWRGGNKPVDVFDAKADLAALLDVMGYDIDKLQLVAEPAAWAHPGRGGRLQLGPKNAFAWFGELHPALVAELDLDGPVVAFELDLDALPEPKKKPTRTKPQLVLSDLMPLSRDFAFVVDAGVAAQSILKAAQGADKRLITGASVFDIYEGEHVGPGKKSVAIAVDLQPRDRTLTDEDIEAVSAAVVASVTKATGGVLRS